MVNVRLAKAGDAGSILEIYAPHVLYNACTFETHVPSVEEFEARITKCLQKFPWLVCEIDGRIAGYVYASPHREREAYQWTCESSVYVHKDFKGKGIGRELYKTLFQLLKMQGLVNVYAGITLPNDASVRLHEVCGFQLFAEYDNIGYKLGAWQKVGWWKLQLNKHELKPSPPLLFSELNLPLLPDLLTVAANNIKARYEK
ncbi:GNAT family N-acetyltransferase [Flavisolibacter ginsenosidimutans]|uniref:N-acetyltransferase n=1 Tax=Flavisolibacter ginsenosidimutans TaxID=661481 RepID=A0A5B8UJ13_9BACT|nr:GNAT family N-acetyltransferase [Flavisolibacter ginsenosidimutans]QEC56090.1 N-acetyltransferase [Flavisolibacter ginsenosidimutans]